MNLGCGRDIKSGWINLDRANISGVDVVFDIESGPLPFADCEFDEILCQDVLEHVDCPKTMRELHRVLAPQGLLHIRVPHFSSTYNYIDPTHRNRFSVRTFLYFVKGAGFDYYFDFSFSQMSSVRISFLKRPYFYNHLVDFFVNRSSRMQWVAYENTGLSRLFPALNIECTLIK